MKFRALVCTGHGINCEYETADALRLAGFNDIDLVHLNVITSGSVNIFAYNLIVFPGGFLDGDDLGAAQACVNRIRFSVVDKRPLIDLLLEYIQKNGLMLGICNGFQLLTKLGMLPAQNGTYERQMTLTSNDSGRFEDRWTKLIVDTNSPCIFTKGLTSVYLPVRHGEGKLIGRDPLFAKSLVENHLATLRYSDPCALNPTMEYPWNPNGSDEAIAGVCDATGRVFGLMPHPECFVHRVHHPRWTREQLPEEGDGLLLFKNAIRYLSEC
jgi:phosphoribosylformylglycinamidine synthase subunit PurQ / glutaminase